MTGLKVGFQGSLAAHSQLAIVEFVKQQSLPSTPLHPLFPRSLSVNQVETVPVPSTLELLDRLLDGAVDFAFLPAENSQSGSFTQLYDLLLQKYAGRLHVVGEFAAHDQNALLCLPDAGVSDLADIDCVYSHPHVLEQCSQLIHQIRLKRQGKPFHVLGTEDTASAASFLLQDVSSKSGAVLASSAAAKQYGLRILKDIVDNDVRSVTRYIILASKPLSREQLLVSSQMVSSKTSVAVSLKNSPGMLFKALSCFAMRDINVCKLESRPALSMSSSPWEYVNYIDFESGQQQSIDNVLANLKEYAVDVKVFGTYPRYSSGGGQVSASYGV